MSFDILDLGRFEPNKQAIDIALPVLAVECEATPPLENYLDVYEETVLRLVSIGLSAHGIAKALNATESLVFKILTRLEEKQYAQREQGKPWKLTSDGEKYLNGSVISERASSESQYGYMFINAIKKEILPYFYLGDVGQIALFRGSPLPLKVTLEGDEQNTFSPISIKRSKLKKAYKAYYKNLSLSKELNKGEITREEAIDLFADLETLVEETEEEPVEASGTAKSNNILLKNMFIRPLNEEPKNKYLRMRIIIDPSYPGGYRAESPFDFGGIDNNFFLRQLQWMELSDTAFLDGKPVKDFLHSEICKISPAYKREVKDYQVFLIEQLPLLKIYRNKLPYVYDDMERIHALMKRQHSLLEKENIVNNLARCVVEGLFNDYFRAVEQEKMNQVQQKAFEDILAYGCNIYKQRICDIVHMDKSYLDGIGTKYLHTIIKRLNRTYGNSIVEKFINMLVVEYHLGDARMKKFLLQPNINQKYKLIDKLNKIRIKVSHDTGDKFSNTDYKEYTDNVFVLVNSLLEAYREE